MDQLECLRAALANRYDVDREIGRGGMARVYLAHDRQHDRDVAIKVLSPDLAAAIGAERFLREIRIAARLQHPHIVPLYDSGSAQDLLYYVMPYIGGQSLRERLHRETQLPLGDAVRITREVADALNYAHAQGVVHRDIKPGNILLAGYPSPPGTRGGWHAVVADFGIARAAVAVGEEPLTGSGVALGTPEYMSPEQGSGDPGIDGRSDVYALGCVLYEMIAGTPPFSSRTVQAMLARHRYDTVPPLHVVRPSVPAEVEAAVMQALAKVPADRFATAAEFSEALEHADDTRSTPARLLRPMVRRLRRPRVLAALGACAVAAAAIVVGAHLRGGGSSTVGDPAWILVADFEGPPGDPTLATAVRELVTAELDQSRSIGTMPRQQIAAVLRDAGLADTVALTGARARELAVRSSVRAILSGSVLPVGAGRYSIVLRVADADSGRTLLTVTGAASDQDLIPAVQGAARRVREGLGDRRADIEANKPLVQVATPSFPAYRRFVEAVALSERGELAGSNRLLREAIVLDTGFASAWATTAMNFLTMRDLDSAGIALSEALRRPARLSDAERYRLEAEAAYALRYDVASAVRWYDLLLQIAPRSISAHNDRGVYLYSLGRYEEALAEFSRAEKLELFGVEQAQIEIFNQVVTLLALGRDADAASTARRLRGLFADYAADLLATFRGQWGAAESLATHRAGDPSTPSWVRIPATTMLAGALAARGAVEAADGQLRDAAASPDASSRPWFCNAVLLLAAATGRPPGSPPRWLLADTTSGGLMAAALWASRVGDTATAAARLGALQRLPTVQVRRLGLGPSLVRASVLASQERWADVIGELGAAAVVGERDGGDLGQVSSMAVRWLAAEAYERVGRADSASVMYEMVLDPSRTPFGHLALRGLVYSFARRRLALLYDRLGRREAADSQWNQFRSTFVTPDRGLRGLITEGR